MNRKSMITAQIAVLIFQAFSMTFSSGILSQNSKASIPVGVAEVINGALCHLNNKKTNAVAVNASRNFLILQNKKSLRKNEGFSKYSINRDYFVPKAFFTFET